MTSAIGVARASRDAARTRARRRASVVVEAPIAGQAGLTMIAAVRVLALRPARRRRRSPPSASWMTLRSADGIGSSERATPDSFDLLGDVAGEPLEGDPALLAIAGDVDAQPRVVIPEAALGGDPGEVLDRQQRAPPGTDQQAERRHPRRRCAPRSRCRRRVVDGRAVETEGVDQAAGEAQRPRWTSATSTAACSASSGIGVGLSSLSCVSSCADPVDSVGVVAACTLAGRRRRPATTRGRRGSRGASPRLASSSSVSSSAPSAVGRRRRTVVPCGFAHVGARRRSCFGRTGAGRTRARTRASPRTRPNSPVRGSSSTSNSASSATTPS